MEEEILFYYNNKIEIDKDNILYKSSIQEIGDDYIGISIPVNSGQYLAMPNDTDVDVLYYLDRDVYKFRTKVIGTKMDKILIVVLKKPDTYIKVQRRNYARAGTLTNITYARQEGKDYKYYDAVMLDLSGGGARLHVTRKLRFGEVIIISIPLKDEDITVKAQIIRIEDEKNENTCIGVCFVDIDKGDREKIIKHVFNLMREQMQRSVKGD